MKPTRKQLETIFFLFNDYCGRTHGDICQDIWDFVESELNKIHPLPGWESETEYKCRNCHEASKQNDWEFEFIENSHTITCPRCGAVHSEMAGR